MTAPQQESWSLKDLVAVFASHRTAFYSLWNYLWLVIVASLIASYSVDKTHFNNSDAVVTAFRIFALVGFVIYAFVNYSLSMSVRNEMQTTVDAIRARLRPEDAASIMPLSVSGESEVRNTHVFLDLGVFGGHLILILGPHLFQ